MEIQINQMVETSQEFTMAELYSMMDSNDIAELIGLLKEAGEEYPAFRSYHPDDVAAHLKQEMMLHDIDRLIERLKE